MDTPDFSGFLNEFLEEAEEHLQTLNACLLELEEGTATGAPPKEKIDSLFRAAHTVKGLAGMMEFDKIARLCQKMEDIFGEFRQERMPVTPATVDALFGAVDMLAKLIAAVKGEEGDKAIAIDAVLARLDKALQGGEAPGAHAAEEAAAAPKGRAKRSAAKTILPTPAELGVDLGAARLDEKETAVLADAVKAGLWIYELSKEFVGGTPLDKLHRLPVFLDIEKAGMLIAAVPPVEQIPSVTGTVNCRLLFSSSQPSAAMREHFLDPVKVLRQGTAPEAAAIPADKGEEPAQAPALDARKLTDVLAELDESLVHEFVKSATESMDQIDLTLLELERDPANLRRAGDLQKAFRAFKGKGALFGFNKLALLASKLESVFGQVAKERLVSTAELFEAVAAAMEKLKHLLDELKIRKESGVAVEPELRQLEGLEGKKRRKPEELKAVMAAAALPPDTASQLSLAEQSLIAEEHQKGRSIFQITIRFTEDVIRSGYEPLSLVPILEKIGNILVSIPLIDGVPEVFKDETEKWHIGFHFLLATNQPLAALQERFAMLPRFMEIELREVLPLEAAIPVARPAAPAAPFRAATVSAAQAVTVRPAPKEEPEFASSTAEAEKKMKEKAVNTIRVDIDRLDKLLNLIGELVIDRTRLEQLSAEIRKRMPNDPVTVQLAHTNQLFQRHMNEIQDMVMSVRMVPIGNAFNKFPRIVRDLAKSLGKSVNLTLSGEETELDKTLIEEVGDPLVHLIRNAIDHGIETPEARRAAGKPETGQLTLKAFHEGDTIIIEASDDGRGMNIAKIRARAIDRGLIDPDDPPPTDRDVLQYIFEPGFSTADAPTLVSGRGVGMDVVKKNIMKLKGLIDINTEEGKGTTIRLRLPLTLAIVPTLIVGVRDETFAIPLSSVAESIRINASDVRMVHGREMITLRDAVLPLVRLDQLFRLDRKPRRATPPPAPARPHGRRQSLFIVVVGLAEKRLGLIVNDLKRQQEVVIKNLGDMLKDAPGVSGATIMGDGRVALILDAGQIIEEAARQQRHQPAPANEERG